MYEFSGCFHKIVTNVSISARMQEECDVLCLQIAKVAKGTVNLAEYMLCMPASLRSLLPKGWSTVREVAWTWLWEDVERLLLRNIGNPLVWERRLAKLFPGIDEQQECELRAAIHTRFFALTPAGKDCFKQSNTYLHVTADKVLDVSVTFFREPAEDYRRDLRSGPAPRRLRHPHRAVHSLRVGLRRGGVDRMPRRRVDRVLPLAPGPRGRGCAADHHRGLDDQ